MSFRGSDYHTIKRWSLSQCVPVCVCAFVNICVRLGATKLWSLSMWRGEHMGTEIDHLTEQRTGGGSEVLCYSTLSIVSVSYHYPVAHKSPLFTLLEILAKISLNSVWHIGEPYFRSYIFISHKFSTTVTLEWDIDRPNVSAVYLSTNDFILIYSSVLFVT